MANDADAGDSAGTPSREGLSSPHPIAPSEASSDSDDRTSNQVFDLARYAEDVYRANLALGLADEQEHGATQDLQNLLAKATAAQTVRRERKRRIRGPKALTHQRNWRTALCASLTWRENPTYADP
jgi:hypothetical protein